MFIIPFMKKLNVYIFKQILVGFLLTILSLMAIIWLTQSLRFLDFITNNGISITTFIKLTSLLMPRIFTVLSPIAVFATVLFVYNRMLADRELVVMKSAGISPWQNAKATIFFGVLLCALNFFVYNWGIGWSEKRFNELEWQVKNDVSSLMFKAGEFTQLQNGLTVFVGSHEPDGSITNILINDERVPENKSTVSAQKGRLVYNNNKPRIILVKGIRQEINTKKGQFSSISFDRYSVDFGAPESKEKRRDSVRTMSLSQLLDAPNNLEIPYKDRSRQFAEGNKRLLSPFYNISYALLGCLGLLIGGFNRRGQAKIVSYSILAMILIQATDLIFFSLVTKSLHLVWLMYLNLLLPFSICSYLLFYYRPKKVKKKIPLMALIASLFLGFNTQAQVAGEAVKEQSYSPHAMIEPQKNFSNFMEIENNEEAEIDFSADDMEHNKELSTITATGNVHISRANLTVIADKVVYNQKEDLISAVGNVILIEETGNVVFSDFVELTSKMTKAEMHNVKVLMEDKTRMSASSAQKFENNDKILQNVTYTPCDVCQTKNPLWQLRARKVTHYADRQDVDYNGAWLEVKGVPVFYTPFLSHPDPSVKRRSGFLAPSIGSSSYLGASFYPNYFWDISDHEDLTLSPILSADKGLVLGGTYRKYFARGKLEATGTLLQDDDQDKNRGSLFLTNRYEVNNYWVSNTEINYASDRTYLKDLSLDKQDDPWLTSSTNLQGFDNRNFASIEAYYYKMLSYNLKDSSQPYVLPLFDYENYGDIGRYGAYTKTNFNFASINREREEELSTQRATMINSWVLPYTSPYGEKYKMVASLKTDAYYISNYQENNEDFSGSVFRSFPQIGIEWRMPFVRATQSSRQIFEPVIVAVGAPNGGQKQSKIPNEDSLDIKIDDTNILSLDRYAGYDRNDIGSRVSYGFNWNTYGESTGRTAMFLAQSYKTDASDEFSDAIDGNKEGYFSDYVGRVYAAPNDYLDLDYRFRADKDNLELKYSELGASIGPEIFRAYISYIYLAPTNSKSTLYDYPERQELYSSLTAQLTKDWSLMVYNRQDMSDNGAGSLEHGGSLIYEDECLKLINYIRRVNSIDTNLENDLEFGITFLLKTLGGAGTK